MLRAAFVLVPVVFLRAGHKGRWSLFIMESWSLHRIQWGELNILILCRCAARQSWPVCSLNSATASLRGDSGIKLVFFGMFCHCFPLLAEFRLLCISFFITLFITSFAE